MCQSRRLSTLFAIRANPALCNDLTFRDQEPPAVGLPVTTETLGNRDLSAANPHVVPVALDTTLKRRSSYSSRIPCGNRSLTLPQSGLETHEDRLMISLSCWPGPLRLCRPRSSAVYIPGHKISVRLLRPTCLNSSTTVDI